MRLGKTVPHVIHAHHIICMGKRIVIVSRADPHCCVERDTSRLPLVEHIEMENVNKIIKNYFNRWSSSSSSSEWKSTAHTIYYVKVHSESEDYIAHVCLISAVKVYYSGRHVHDIILWRTTSTCAAPQTLALRKHCRFFTGSRHTAVYIT